MVYSSVYRLNLMDIHLSYGHFDQYMYPYLKADLDNQQITEDEAVELLTNLWIKTLTIQ